MTENAVIHRDTWTNQSKYKLWLKETLLLYSPPPESEQTSFIERPAWTECLEKGKALHGTCKVQGYFEDWNFFDPVGLAACQALDREKDFVDISSTF